MVKKTVFVGLSGGVDSSVAAFELQRSGYNVVGVFIKVWHPTWLTCDWESERLDAMRVAATLKIPFLTCDASETYRQSVAETFIAEYLAGRTPNPDVLCNRTVKFGAFLEFARSHGADYVATGHYAQVTHNEQRAPWLQRGVDGDKDQSYFLWSLTNDQLEQILFPLGQLTKTEVRQRASRARLPTAAKRDSQGVCFLGHIDIPEFLSHYTTLVAGPVLNEAGKQIGTHHGALIYTVGQRHGFLIDGTLDGNTEPHYVLARDIEANTITVGRERPIIESTDHIYLTDCVWREELRAGSTVLAQSRYRQKPFPIRVETLEGNRATVVPLRTTEAVASGQSLVLYNDDRCLGGGIIA